MRRALCTALLGLTLAGCGVPAAVGTSSNNTDDGSVLVEAQYPQCGEMGHRIYRYLLTGDNEGMPDLDGVYAGLVGTTKPIARQTANEYISQCDAEINRAESRRLADERAAAEEAARQDRMTESCAAVHGTRMNYALDPDPRGSYCASRIWRSDPECFQWMSFTRSGAIDQRSIDLQPAKCVR
jgi:hypothetical protein